MTISEASPNHLWWSLVPCRLDVLLRMLAVKMVEPMGHFWTQHNGDPNQVPNGDFWSLPAGSHYLRSLRSPEVPCHNSIWGQWGNRVELYKPSRARKSPNPTTPEGNDKKQQYKAVMWCNWTGNRCFHEGTRPSPAKQLHGTSATLGSSWRDCACLTQGVWGNSRPTAGLTVWTTLLHPALHMCNPMR